MRASLRLTREAVVQWACHAFEVFWLWGGGVECNTGTQNGRVFRATVKTFLDFLGTNLGFLRNTWVPKFIE